VNVYAKRASEQGLLLTVCVIVLLGVAALLLS